MFIPYGLLVIHIEELDGTESKIYLYKGVGLSYEQASAKWGEETMLYIDNEHSIYNYISKESRQ